MRRRPMRSDTADQKSRPPMLKRLRSPTKPAAASGPTRCSNASWISTDACPSTPMPAATFRQRTSHSSQNAFVRSAARGETSLCCDALGRRDPAVRLPAGLRQADGERAGGDRDGVDEPHHHERLGDADRDVALEGADQRDRERRADHRPAAEAHDREAGGQPAPVREPLDEHGDRRDVAEPEAEPADDAVTEVDEDDLVGVDADRRQDETRRRSTRRP